MNDDLRLLILAILYSVKQKSYIQVFKISFDIDMSASTLINKNKQHDCHSMNREICR